jgi:hypothetical protein
VLPRRLGVRFALEAGFLVLLALGAGLANLRPLYIVIIMGAAWVLVALAELTAERIDRSPVSYLLPRSAWEEDEGPRRIFGPRVEERTVVAPPDPAVKQEAPESAEAEPEPEELTMLEPAPEPVLPPAEEPEPEPAAAESPSGPSFGLRVRSLLRRREPEPDAPEATPPRHVKLLPRRTAPESTSRAAQEVAELFGPPAQGDDEAEKPKETGT